MPRLAVLLTAAAASGCFYTGSINDRPATELRKITPGTPFRGDTILIETDSIDPNGDAVTVTWTATSCAAGGVACAVAPFANGFVEPSLKRTFEVTVPRLVNTRAVLIVAHTEDRFGAPALLDAELVIDIANHVPEIQPLQYAAGPPGGPTTITARVDDADDDPDGLTFTSWRVMAPPGGDTTPPFTKISDNAADPTRTWAEQTYRLEPDIEGGWWIEVIVTDPLGASAIELVEIPIGPDRPPCIADGFPLASPPGAVMTLDELRRFSILVVSDDLDVFPPPPPGDPYRGETTFRWAVASPLTGGAFAALTGATGNFVEVDPATYDPGDRVDVRVEIEDRIARTLPCPVAQPSCAIEPTNPTCIQRQTWALEVR